MLKVKINNATSEFKHLNIIMYNIKCIMYAKGIIISFNSIFKLLMFLKHAQAYFIIVN